MKTFGDVNHRLRFQFDESRRRRNERSMTRLKTETIRKGSSLPAEVQYMSVRPIPQGYHTVTPYITVNNATQEIDFYTRAFGAKEITRMAGPDGKIMHAELKIGDSMIMLADEMQGNNCRSPKSLGGATGSIFLYFDDVDKAFQQAKSAGGKVEMPPHRSVRPLLVDGHAQGRRESRRDEEANAARDGQNVARAAACQIGGLFHHTSTIPRKIGARAKSNNAIAPSEASSNP